MLRVRKKSGWELRLRGRIDDNWMITQGEWRRSSSWLRRIWRPAGIVHSSGGVILPCYRVASSRSLFVYNHVVGDFQRGCRLVDSQNKWMRASCISDRMSLYGCSFPSRSAILTCSNLWTPSVRLTRWLRSPLAAKWNLGNQVALQPGTV